MTMAWIDCGEKIRYSCNECKKVLKIGTDETLPLNVVVDYKICEGKEKELHFCNVSCRKQYTSNIEKENKNGVSGQDH